jgi:hypothetical protein
MRRLAQIAALFLLTWGGPVLAASKVEDARASAAAARRQVVDIRSQQMATRQELNQLAARIQGLKAAQKGRIRVGSELDTALRRSQELSGTLTSIAQRLAAAESGAERENLALLSALSQEIGRVRAEFDKAQSRDARRELIARMRSLKAEREQIRAALPAAVVPALEDARASDDPEDLLEQADALRDNEDKVRRELKSLEARIAEAREERELDRRMSDFIGEQSMFDEHDRRVQLQTQTTEVSTQATGGGNAPAAQAPAAGSRGEGPAPVGPQTAGPNFESTSKDSLDPGQAAPPPEPSITVTHHTERAVDARPVIGVDGERLVLSGSADQSLEALEAHRKKLKALADELEKRAQGLENKARTLK